jgi:hypothetical protein
MKIIRYVFSIVLALGFISSCTDLDYTYYDNVVPSTFYKSETDVKAALYRPFTHARWYVEGDRWKAQEITADQFAVSTKGGHWYNNGEFLKYIHHSWEPTEGFVWGCWRGTVMGITLAIDSRQDLEKLDYSKLNLTEDDKADHVNQLNTLIGYFYLRGLDFFGGMPIVHNLVDGDLKRATDKETFTHIETILKEAITKLPAKTEGQEEEGAIKKAGAAAMLAQLYFNAESYIGEDKFAQCAAICQDIIDKKYGFYELDSDWRGPHGFNNHNSKEIIWSTPSQFKKLQYEGYFWFHNHYSCKTYYNAEQGGSNGCHLTPSLKPDSTEYTFKLGKPYSKFHNSDLRKKNYAYLGGGKYEGMFLNGLMVSPITGDTCFCTEEYKDKPLVFRDQVAKFKGVDPSNYATLESTLLTGEENSGVRFHKVPLSSIQDENLKWESDNPVIRLAEIYYMLAECKLRAGDKPAAATLINSVRKRNFENKVDPDPVTAANLDKYRMVKEWGVEFLGESRRRTDLIRWNMFTTEKWWDHEASESYRRRFPIPERALSANNNLKQNPGY